MAKSGPLKELRDIKTAFRDEARERRAEAARAGGPGAAARLAENIVALLGGRPSATLSAFLPIADEIDPMPAAARLAATGWALALPVVVGKAQPLSFRAWRDGEPLEHGPLKTRHPLATAPELIPDVLVVPLLAFDAAGRRIGWGGGFYDRTLAALRMEREILAVGVGYAGQQVDKVPHGPHDAPLDAMATDRGVIRIKGDR